MRLETVSGERCPLVFCFERALLFSRRTSASADKPLGAEGAYTILKGALSLLTIRNCWLPQGQGELRLAGFGGIVEGVAGAVAFGCFEEESVLEAVGEAGETGLSVDVGADLKIEFAD